MGKSYEENVEYIASERERSFDVVAPFRAGFRFMGLLLFTALMYGASVCTAPLGLFSTQYAARARRRVSRSWTRGVCRLLGNRLRIVGSPPRPQYFLATNHLTWIDAFAGMSFLEGRPVAEEPVGRVPILGRLMRGLDPIFVRRVKEDTARVNNAIVEALRAGDSIVLAPEYPRSDVRRGAGVRQFRGGLLESAVRTGMPVHYMVITYRTPPGYPPPSKSIVFGPNPFLRDPDGSIAATELKLYGPPRSFLWHLLGVLSLPWHESEFCFGAETITADDRITLANRLQEVVEKVFVPVE